MEGRLILLVLMAFVTPARAWANSTWSECGASQLCVTSPSGCSPNQTCLFGSVTNVSMPNVTTLVFQLEGHSSGYITLVLSEPSMNSSTNFTCGHNASANNSFYFSSPLTNQAMITFEGSVSGDFINCTFNFTLTNLTSIFNTSNLDLFKVSLSSFPSSTTTPPTTVNGTAATPTTVNGTAATPTTVNGTAATNTTVNGTAATNTRTTTTTTTLMPATTKPTGASGALHPYASLLLLSFVSLFVLQKV